MTFNTLNTNKYNTNTEQKREGKLQREDSLSSNKVYGIGNPHNNSSLCLYGTESEIKVPSNYKLNISNIQQYEEDELHCNDFQLEKIGETDREYGSPKNNTKEEQNNMNSELRQSHFKDIDNSSLQETKEMVRVVIVM